MSSGYSHGPRGKFGKMQFQQNAKTEPWDQPMAVATDAMGRMVTSYVTHNLEGNSAIRKAEMLIEGRGERFDGGGTGMHQSFPAQKHSSSNSRAEEMVEQVVMSAVANGLGRQGQGGQYGGNQNGRAGFGGMFRRDPSNFNGGDGWGRGGVDASMGVPQTYYDDGYRGEFDGGTGRGSGDEWGRPGSMYPSGQGGFPMREMGPQPTLDSREAARRYHGGFV